MFHFVGSSMASSTKQLQMNDNCWNKSLWPVGPASSKNLAPSYLTIFSFSCSSPFWLRSISFPSISDSINKNHTKKTYLCETADLEKKTHSIDHMAQGRPTQPLPLHSQPLPGVTSGASSKGSRSLNLRSSHRKPQKKKKTSQCSSHDQT